VFNHFSNPAQQIEQLELAPQNPKTTPKGIPKKHMDALLKYLHSLPKNLNNLRDLALIHFLYRTGARAGEVSTLNTKILQLDRTYAVDRLNVISSDVRSEKSL
jgi:site-specific recombinase XerD